MSNYEEERAKLTTTRLNKLKSPAKYIYIYKNFQDGELPQEYFLTERQKPEIKNAFSKICQQI